jgi:hypothetical protein
MAGKSDLADPARDFLTRYAAELDALATDLAFLQHALVEHGLSDARSRLNPQLQSLDDLTQRAEALAEIAHRLAMAGAPTTTEAGERLVQGVKLAQLGRRLLGRDPRPGMASGDIDLF